MEVVHQAKPHSMGWCLDCHRASEKNLRPLDQILNFDYDAGKMDRADFYQGLVKAGHSVDELVEMICEINHVKPPEGVKSEEDLMNLAKGQFGDKLNQLEVGRVLKEIRGIHPPEHCSACHR